jgi:hypothetical protein
VKHRLPLPPFGRELAIAVRRRQQVNLFVHAGHRAWERARYRKPPNVLCLPPGDDFQNYDWSCVRGVDLALVVWNWPQEQVDLFARHLVAVGGASLVAALSAEHDGNRVFRVRHELYKPKLRIFRKVA